MRTTRLIPSSALRRLSAVLALTLGCAGCATAPKLSEGLGNMGDKLLETIGFKKPEMPKMPDMPEAAKPARTLNLRLAASESLNVDDQGKSLSLLVRVYKLRSTSAFLNAPIETFGNTGKEKEVLGDELLESREIVLLPGKQSVVTERWAREAAYVGLVAFYRTPIAQGTRQAFELEALPIGNEIVIGAHACGLSIASGMPLGQRTATPTNNFTGCPIRRNSASLQTAPAHLPEKKT